MNRESLRDVIIISFIIIAFVASWRWLSSDYKDTAQPVAQEFRFLQRCGGGMTVEYKATRRLPLDAVCGPADYSKHDVEEEAK